ncbi:ATPase synthesis protein 25 mitochondrial [Clarireedia jacksonii]
MWRSLRNDFAQGNFRGAYLRVLRMRQLYPELDTDGGSLWRSTLKNQIISYLTHAPVEEATRSLGNGYDDELSSFFLKLFNLAVSNEDQKRDWNLTFWLYTRARELGHPGYDVRGLMRLFEESVEAGVVLPEEAYLSILRSVLQPVQQAEIEEQGGRRIHHIQSMSRAFSVIRVMHRHGKSILTENMFVTLLEATEPLKEIKQPTVTPRTTVNDSFNLPTKPMPRTQRRIHLLMISLDLPPFTDHSRMRLMEMYARNQHWVAFWDVWRLPLRYNYPQSAAMYEFMFRKVAETGHEAACMKVLRTWMENLYLEEPPVKLEGNVAEAVKACILAADPYVEVEAADPEKHGEWISLWRRCEGDT